MTEDRSNAVASRTKAQDRALIRVLAAVIRRGDRYLLCLRPADKRHGGLWEFPGGKLESGENLFDAASREMEEELGVGALSVGNTLYRAQDPGSPFVIEFVEVDIQGTPEPREHDEIRWATVREIQQLRLAPADHAFSLSLPSSST